MLTMFEFQRPAVACQDPAALRHEEQASACDARHDWPAAAQAWRQACSSWAAVGEHGRAEWALQQAGGAEVRMDPEWQRLYAAGQTRTVRLCGTEEP